MQRRIAAGRADRWRYRCLAARLKPSQIAAAIRVLVVSGGVDGVPGTARGGAARPAPSPRSPHAPRRSATGPLPLNGVEQLGATQPWRVIREHADLSEPHRSCRVGDTESSADTPVGALGLPGGAKLGRRRRTSGGHAAGLVRTASNISATSASSRRCVPFCQSGTLEMFAELGAATIGQRSGASLACR
jgi:hypothetical protein